MTTEQLLREAAQQALEDLRAAASFTSIKARNRCPKTIKRLQEALAQPAEGGEVVTVTSKLGDLCSFRSASVRKGDKLYTTPPASQEQAQQPSFEMPDLEASYKAADALYEIGYRHSGRHDFDPRGNAEWQRVVDMISASHAQQPKPKPMTDAPEIVERVMRYAGKTIREARNPCITARETIVLADWLASHGITGDKEPCHARQKA